MADPEDTILELGVGVSKDPLAGVQGKCLAGGDMFIVSKFFL